MKHDFFAPQRDELEAKNLSFFSQINIPKKSESIKHEFHPWRDELNADTSYFVYSTRSIVCACQHAFINNVEIKTVAVLVDVVRRL